MITCRLGKMVGDQAIYMDKVMLTESVIGQVYELQLRTEGIETPEVAAAAVSRKLKEKFNATILYFEVDDDIITIQIEGSPFAWAQLLVFLPEILGVLGIVVLLIMVFLVGSTIPSWQYGLGAAALSLIFLAPNIISKMAMMKVKE